MVAQRQPGVLLAWALTALSVVALCRGRSLASDNAPESPSHVKAIGIGIAITRTNGAPTPDTLSTDARRKLLSPGGCSDLDSSVLAVLECTNAVRANPDRFAADYPCHYDSWKHEVQGNYYPALQAHAMLSQVAQMHSDDQARSDHMSHMGSDGSSLGVRVDRSGFDWGKVGENVAVGYDSAKEVVMAWMCSPTHRRNVMNCNYNLLGIGCSWSQQGLHYFTQNFGCAANDVCECGQPYRPPIQEPVVEPFVDHQFNMYSMQDGEKYRDHSDGQNFQWFSGQDGQQDGNNNEVNQDVPDVPLLEGDPSRMQRGSLRDQLSACNPRDPGCSRSQSRSDLRASLHPLMDG